MRQNFRLIREPVGNNLSNQYNDVLRVKSALSGLGLFEEETMHGYVTREMDSALKNLQRESGLQIDGRLFPEGETETEILRRLVDSGGAPLEPVQKEKLVPYIPGTNIPDQGIAEDGVPPKLISDRMRYEMDPYILRSPPVTRDDIEWQGNEYYITGRGVFKKKK